MTKKHSVTCCSNCLSMSTRPRITFDAEGVCNACQWSKKKQTLDWDLRLQELRGILDDQKSKNQPFDCLVPVSGGKDGSYIAYTLKHKYGINPLCVTVLPPLSTELGLKNLQNFVNSGYDHITISPSQTGMQKLNKLGLFEMGFPYYGWLIAIHTAVYRVAEQYGIDLIFYGEDGEVEYGGKSETQDSPFYNIDYQKRIYLEQGHDAMIEKASLDQNERVFFIYPRSSIDIKMTHWSYFENWDPYRNYLVAKQHCGLQESDNTNSGTFTNFAQNDQYLYTLHCYLMFLKFGFGRANQDACIEIRRGAMERSQALNLVRLYDGSYPSKFIEKYLDYYRINKQDFDDLIDKWANKDILVKVDGIWVPNFEIV